MRESRYLKANKQNMLKLLSIPVLKEFETRDLEELLRVSKVRQYKSGELIIKEGEMGNQIFFLITGQVRISKNNEDISFLRRTGDLFGEMGLIRDMDRSASVYAVGETVCLTTDSSYISRISGKDKITFCYILYRGIAGILADRLNETDLDLAKTKAENTRLTNIINSKKN